MRSSLLVCGPGDVTTSCRLCEIKRRDRLLGRWGVSVIICCVDESFGTTCTVENNVDEGVGFFKDT